MLDVLFGNKSVQRILYFLLINGKCYAGKLSRHFKTPLTPIQQGLAKLEEIGIVESYYEGKTRMYELNRECPYLQELESLLRKTYTLLPVNDKKEYYDPDMKQKSDKPRKLNKGGQSLVISVWDKLIRIRHLSFSAVSLGLENTGWNGVGKGRVHIQKQSDDIVVFEEHGSWTSKEGTELTFKNVFRWTLDRFQQLITLEHMRFGENNPVFLFHLAQTEEDCLESVNSHICKEDTYLGQVRCSDHSIKLNWRIIGPKKNEEINYIYT
jgi:DNA-binding transcriptional ArsR family regulator